MQANGTTAMRWRMPMRKAPRLGRHEVRHIAVGSLGFPVLRSQEDWERGALPAGLAQAQHDIA
jgi:hypothetical protein